MLAKPFIPKRSRIEMVPLIDMFFLLLVFFIFGVFSMTMQQGLIVDLTTAETAVATPDEDVLTLSLTADGGLFFNQQPVALDGLAGMLQHHAARPEALVAINADRRVPHGTVMRVLDAVRQAGLSRVSFQAIEDS